MKKVIISGLIVTIIGGLTVEIVRNKYLFSEDSKQTNNSDFFVPTPEVLAYEILGSLRDSDAVRFQNIVPTNKDFQSLLALVPKEKKLKFTFQMKKLKDEYGDPGTFLRLYKVGRKLQIDWRQIKDIKIKADIVKNEYFNTMFSDEIFIYFSYENEEYRIKIDDAIKVSRGWVLYDSIQLNKKITKHSDTKQSKYDRCVACHGENAEKKALGVSQIIAGWEIEKIKNVLHGYKNGSYGGSMKGVMKEQTMLLNDTDIDDIAKYINNLK